MPSAAPPEGSVSLEPLRAGVAEDALPRADGLDLAGFVARENPSRGVRDDVFARALALESGERLLVLLVADALGFTDEFVAKVRARIAARVRAPAPDVMIAATHTHSAPASMPLRNCGAVDAAWLERAGETLAAVAVAATERLQPARLGVGVGQVPGVAGNRRAPGFPDVIGAPTDDALGVIRVETTGGAPLACLVYFACHPVILGPENRDVSADFPGQLVRLLQNRLGATTLFVNGATGDINPRRRGHWADVEFLADALSAEAERVWTATTMTAMTAEVALSAASDTLRLPLLPLPTRAELETLARRFRDERDAARTAGNGTAARVADAFLQWAEAAQSLGDEAADDLFSRAEIQVLRVGAAVLVAVPAELFAGLGMEIQRQLAERGVRPVFVIGYANGNIGYVPTRDAYARGGYEVETAHRFYGRPACVAPEAGERIVAAAVEMAARVSEAPA